MIKIYVVIQPSCIFLFSDSESWWGGGRLGEEGGGGGEARPAGSADHLPQSGCHQGTARQSARGRPVHVLRPDHGSGRQGFVPRKSVKWGRFVSELLHFDYRGHIAYFPPIHFSLVSFNAKIVCKDSFKNRRL